jgi:hypothetical protein
MKDIRVFPDHLWAIALWERNEAVLKGPPQKNLCWCSVVLVGYFQEIGMLHERPTAKRGVRFHLDAVFSTVLNYWPMLTERMELYGLNTKALQMCCLLTSIWFASGIIEEYVCNSSKCLTPLHCVSLNRVS